MTVDFETLIGQEQSLTTLAYWLGVLNEWPPTASASALHSAMGYQYDIEDQAGYVGYVFPPDASWPELFAPVAPVQLTRTWSPLPTAVSLLGQADWSDQYARFGVTAVAAAWAASTIRSVSPTAPTGATTDARRFSGLLAVAMERSLASGGGILLVAKPGWSYEHGFTFDSATRALMETAGFAVLDRHAS